MTAWGMDRTSRSGGRGSRRPRSPRAAGGSWPARGSGCGAGRRRAPLRGVPSIPARRPSLVPSRSRAAPRPSCRPAGRVRASVTAGGWRVAARGGEKFGWRRASPGYRRAGVGVGTPRRTDRTGGEPVRLPPWPAGGAAAAAPRGLGPAWPRTRRKPSRISCSTSRTRRAGVRPHRRPWSRNSAWWRRPETPRCPRYSAAINEFSPYAGTCRSRPSRAPRRLNLPE